MLSIFSVIYFRYFWEIIPLFLISDFMFGVGEARFFGITIFSTILIIIILLISEFTKKKLKFYKN